MFGIYVFYFLSSETAFAFFDTLFSITIEASLPDDNRRIIIEKTKQFTFM